MSTSMPITVSNTIYSPIMLYISFHSSVCDIYCCSCYRLYLKFSLETIVATAFGDSVQTGEQGSDNVITATNEFVNAFLESVSNRAEESTLILCESL